MGRTAIQKKENVDGWSWKFGPKIAWLLLFLLIPIAGCGKSEPVPDKPGELRILTDASIHPHLQSLFRSRAEEWNAPEAVWVSARPEELLAAAAAGRADLLIVAGKGTVQAVNRKCGELASSKAFAANAVELVAMKDRKIRLKKPKHLLQPILKGPAIPVSSDALGRKSEEILRDWKYDKRLARKLRRVGDSMDALENLRAGKVGAAFVYHTDTIRAVDVESLFQLPRRTRNHIPYLAVIPKNGQRPAKARKIMEILENPAVYTQLSAAGFLHPDPLEAKRILNRRRKAGRKTAETGQPMENVAAGEEKAAKKPPALPGKGPEETRKTQKNAEKTPAPAP